MTHLIILKNQNTIIAEKKIGIWTNHSNAHLIELSTDSNETKPVEAKFSNDTKDHGSGKNENQMNNKAQQHQSEYYKN